MKEAIRDQSSGGILRMADSLVKDSGLFACAGSPQTYCKASLLKGSIAITCLKSDILVSI
jgi:hypothetical protein